MTYHLPEEGKRIYDLLEELKKTETHAWKWQPPLEERKKTCDLLGDQTKMAMQVWK
jgi:hypothetical protein